MTIPLHDLRSHTLDDDALERELKRQWVELRRVFRRLDALKLRAAPDDVAAQQEIVGLERRLAQLRRRTHRYAEVLRNEANATRDVAPIPKSPIDDFGPEGTPVLGQQEGA